MPRSTLTSKGQITIPMSIRKRLSLEKGDVLEFRITPSGDVKLRKVTEPRLGVLRDFAPKAAVTVAEMKAAVRRRAKFKVARDSR